MRVLVRIVRAGFPRLEPISIDCGPIIIYLCLAVPGSGSLTAP